MQKGIGWVFLVSRRSCSMHQSVKDMCLNAALVSVNMRLDYWLRWVWAEYWWICAITWAMVRGNSCNQRFVLGSLVAMLNNWLKCAQESAAVHDSCHRSACYFCKLRSLNLHIFKVEKDIKKIQRNYLVIICMKWEFDLPLHKNIFLHYSKFCFDGCGIELHQIPFFSRLEFTVT